MIGRNGIPDLNPNGVCILDFCARHELSIMFTLFELRVVHKCTWYNATLGQKSMINVVIVIKPVALCLEHSDEERGKAVNLSPPGGEL